MIEFNVPVLGFAAYSGTGKTTLLVKLIPLLKAKGIRVALIKHAHHDFDIDIPGKDSYELRRAGAGQVLIASSYRQALVTEMQGRDEPRLEDLIDSLDTAHIDLIMVEGFRHLAFPKIELHRPSLNKDFIFPNDPDVIAVASDKAVDTGSLPLLDINRPEEVEHFIREWLGRAGWV